MCELNQPINVTRVIEFQPGSSYLLIIQPDVDPTLLSAETMRAVVQRVESLIGKLIGTEVRFEVLVTDTPMDITAYQFKPNGGISE